MSAAAGRKGDSNDDRTTLHKSRRVVLGRNVSRVWEDGCPLQGRQRETGRRAGDNDLSKWPFFPGADRELAPLRMGRPINASPTCDRISGPIMPRALNGACPRSYMSVAGKPSKEHAMRQSVLMVMAAGAVTA